MTTVDTPIEITEAGVVRGLPLDDYLADPVAGGSLSHSGAKTLVTKTPALFAYEREHGRPDSRSFDFGHAAHQRVLGVGPDLVVVQRTAKDGAVSDAENYQTKSAQEHRDEIRARGAVPVLREEFDAITAMAEAIKTHPIASRLIAPGSGEAEVSAFAQDDETGVWLRCRYDWLRPASTTGRLLLVDYKTAVNAESEAFAKTAVSYGYHLQDAFYSDVARLLRLADDIAFLFIVQEKSAPYLVNVVQLDSTARAIGALLRRRAVDTYKRCTETGEWPGYGNEVNLASLPAWYERQFEMDLS